MYLLKVLNVSEVKTEHVFTVCTVAIWTPDRIYVDDGG